MSIASKFTKIDYLESAIVNGVRASELASLNDPYEWAGVRYPELFKVCCLSKAKFKMLMWSHYATHCGCRIDFEIPDEYCDLVRDVEYTDHFTQHADMANEELRESLYQKGAEWKYEEEIRAVWCGDLNDNRWIETEDGVFLKAQVVRVTFGLFADDQGDKYKDALSFIANHNDACDETSLIEVHKCRMKNAQYQLAYDSQYDYKKELNRL